MKGAPSKARTEASITSFTQLGLSARLERALSALRITVPTPIQASALPSIFSSSDIIAGSPTGSGKTLAFALPILSSLEKDLIAGAAVILTPTRELAQQLYEQIVAVATGAALGVNVALVLGGQDMMRQAQLLNQRPNIVVATPGRLADLLGNADHQALSRCKYVVLDEADRLLTPTFSDALSTIFSALPPSSMRQTLLFSATLTPAIEALATKPRSAEERPVRVCRIEGPTSTPPQLVQKYIFVPSHVREPYLYHLLLNAPCPSRSKGDGRSKWEEEEASGMGEEDEDDLESKVVPTIIFVSRCRTAALLCRMLEELGIPSTTLHSHLLQSDRTANLQSFRARKIPILITTDVGSRGLDVPEVELVVNWDLPRDWRDYVHRVGRTARAGREGSAVSFVGERDVELLKGIEQNIHVEMTEHSMPEEKVLERLNAVSTAKRIANLELHDTKFGARQEHNKKKAAERVKIEEKGRRRKKSKAPKSAS
ncbi:DEAD-domain-containing protein [Ceraceosorus guamensis]|uniref:DEAD-domain-containing protein n=1 Tax=Ceraceosorus guamensis TaxID=1522189 RepID=A0A316VVH4_9BASI|nr:DEAD-domain-containing protein [Ceraceosorus guamensis]PWN41294.1 DEAD-domain-containing protein [Ceraceosorus guamensis]